GPHAEVPGRRVDRDHPHPARPDIVAASVVEPGRRRRRLFRGSGGEREDGQQHGNQDAAHGRTPLRYGVPTLPRKHAGSADSGRTSKRYSGFIPSHALPDIGSAEAGIRGRASERESAANETTKT